MPKAKGDPYFVSCRAGAEAAAKDRDVDMIWDGPTDLDPAKQNEMVEAWITRGVDAIAVSVVNAPGISTVLRKARAAASKCSHGTPTRSRTRAIFSSTRRRRGRSGFTLADQANGSCRVRAISPSLPAH